MIAVAGLAGTAFAASITGLSTSNAGQGSGVVEGYEASNLRVSDGSWLGEGATTASELTEVTFTLTKEGGGGIESGSTAVHAQLLGGESPSDWTTCTVETANAVTCAFDPGKSLAEVTGVSIVAYDSTA